MPKPELIRWQDAADRARVPWPTMVAWMDSGQLEDVLNGFDRLVRQADVDALKAAAPTELPGVTVTEDGLHRIVPGSLRVVRNRQLAVGDSGQPTVTEPGHGFEIPGSPVSKRS